MFPSALGEQLRTEQPRGGTRRWSIVLVAAAAALIGNRYLPYTIRFNYSPLNNVVLILLLSALVAGLIALGTSLRSEWARWPTLAVGLLVALPIGLFALLAGLDAISNAVSGKDLGFEQIAERRTSSAHLPSVSDQRRRHD
jgi:hypothetical protein